MRAYPDKLTRRKVAISTWQIPIAKCPPMNKNRLEKALPVQREQHDAKKLKIPIRYVAYLASI